MAPDVNGVHRGQCKKLEGVIHETGPLEGVIHKTGPLEGVGIQGTVLQLEGAFGKT
jgi:hypothetical protein